MEKRTSVMADFIKFVISAVSENVLKFDVSTPAGQKVHRDWKEMKESVAFLNGK
jgi:hypothetical protein